LKIAAGRIMVAAFAARITGGSGSTVTRWQGDDQH
jgi:hypothetical protein